MSAKNSDLQGENRKIPWERLRRLRENVRDVQLRRLRLDALSCIARGLDAVRPERVVKDVLRVRGSEIEVRGERFPFQADSLHLLAVGKAAVPMALQAMRLLPVASGLVVTNQSGMTLGQDGVHLVVGSHPLPSEESLAAAREAIALVDRLRPNDLLLTLISGGASAMFEASPVALRDLRTCYAELLRSGLSIRDINEVRKGVSEVKGGRLAERALSRGGRVVTLILSDIIGDPIEDIGSGPTAPESSRGARAEEILRRANLWNTMPDSVRQRLAEASGGPGAWRDRSGRVHAFVAAGNDRACSAARGEAERRGYAARIWTTSLQGEAREVGPALVSDALRWNPAASSIGVIAGGETTVTVHGAGRGGRNQELALSAAESLEGQAAVLLSFGTDGADGDTDAAGAIVDGETMIRARALGLDPKQFLDENNSYAFFEALKDHLVTGPTGTNVADLIIVLSSRSATSGGRRVSRSVDTRERSKNRRSRRRAPPVRRRPERR